MIRNKLTLTFKKLMSVDDITFRLGNVYYSNPAVRQTNNDFNVIFNKFDLTADSQSVEAQIIKIKDISVNLLNVYGLSNDVWVTYSNNSITYDYLADNSWAGYVATYPNFNYNNNDIVYNSSSIIVVSKGSDEIIDVNTVQYDYNGGIIPEPPIPMEVKGLESDLYYINNPVFVEVQPSTNGISNYLDLTVTDLQTQKAHTSRIYYFNNNVLTFDIAIVIKSLMKDAQMNFDFTTLTPFDSIHNYGRFKITFNRLVTEQSSNGVNESNYIEITKMFIRGGVREQGSNFTANRNKPLRNSDKFPFWEGYPSAEYYINANNQIVKLNNFDLITNKENIPLNGCNQYLVVFLNQLGGFEQWMFYGSKTDVTSSNDGYSNVFNKIVDFGNSETRTQTVNARIPLAYAGMIPDLLISSVIYIYTKSKGWERVISKGNKVTILDTKRAYEMDFKFEKVNNFNPSNLL